MTDDWDFYLCRVDDHPASIFVDLGAAKEAPLPMYAHMAYVRIHMLKPREDGLSSQDEFDTLISIEDHLSKNLTSVQKSVYVGRNTSNCCRDFYFYTSAPGEWGAWVAELMGAFPAYDYESGTRPDEEWSSYFTFLRPSPLVMESIQNRRTCEELQRNGDSLNEPREIDHWAYFPNQEGLAKFIDAVRVLGFSVRNNQRSEREGLKFGVQIFRIDIPSLVNIDSVTLPLFEAASNAGGEYDGWESQVVA